MIRALVFVLAASPLLAASPPPSDDEIRDTIEQEMEEDDLIDVKVSVKDRAVTLSGTVPSPTAAQRAIDRAVTAGEDADESIKVVSRLKVAATAGDALARLVEAELAAGAPRGALEGVEVAAEDGVVTLRGAARDAETGRDLVERAGRVTGVRHVVSELGMAAPATSDDDLRGRVSAVLGGDALLAARAVGVAVEGGRVVLRGAVPSEQERARAEALARAVPGCREVDNQLTVKR